MHCGAGRGRIQEPRHSSYPYNIPLAVKQVKIPVIAAGVSATHVVFSPLWHWEQRQCSWGQYLCAVKESPISKRRKQALVEADPYDPKRRDVIIHTPTLKEIVKADRSSEGDDRLPGDTPSSRKNKRV